MKFKELTSYSCVCIQTNCFVFEGLFEFLWWETSPDLDTGRLNRLRTPWLHGHWCMAVLSRWSHSFNSYGCTQVLQAGAVLCSELSQELLFFQQIVRSPSRKQLSVMFTCLVLASSLWSTCSTLDSVSCSHCLLAHSSLSPLPSGK